jgi:hypothetical protein
MSISVLLIAEHTTPAAVRRKVKKDMRTLLPSSFCPFFVFCALAPLRLCVDAGVKVKKEKSEKEKETTVRCPALPHRQWHKPCGMRFKQSFAPSRPRVFA